MFFFSFLALQKNVACFELNCLAPFFCNWMYVGNACLLKDSNRSKKYEDPIFYVCSNKL